MTARILVCVRPGVWKSLPADPDRAWELFDQTSGLADVAVDDMAATLGEPLHAQDGAGVWPADRAYVFATRVRRRLGVWCCVLLIQAEPRPLAPSPSPSPSTEPA